jgi:hypothetical protein
MHHVITRIGLFSCAMLVCAQAALAQTPSLRSDIDAEATAIRCELRTWRSPEAVQAFYFYISDARRVVLETDGSSLGNVVQFSRQRIVVSKIGTEIGARTYVFDRMMGALTISIPATQGTRDPWSISGECQKVDASRPKF